MSIYTDKDVFLLELWVNPYENEFLLEYLKHDYQEALRKFRKSKWDFEFEKRYVIACQELVKHLEGISWAIIDLAMV